MPKVTKSAAKSTPRAVVGRPFQRGVYDPTRQGRGPKAGAPNAGRPPEAYKEIFREGYDTKIAARVVAMAAGEAVIDVLDGEGKPTGVKRPASEGVQMKAAEHVGKAREVKGLIGNRLEVEHSQQNPFVVVLTNEKRSEREE